MMLTVNQHWLSSMLANKKQMWPHLVETYGGEKEAAIWYKRWQIFYMACSELFAYNGRDTWGVTQGLFVKHGDSEANKSSH